MVKMGVICPSEIAYRRFMPALLKATDIEFVGVGVCTEKERYSDSLLTKNKWEHIRSAQFDKAKRFVDTYGGKIYNGYEKIISSTDIDAIYIPLPPELHYKWASRALMNNKHVLLEKPSTTTLAFSKELTEVARDRKLAIFENYMFVFHNQLSKINKIVEDGEIGEVRLITLKFGFPRREKDDFRYSKNLGGGALFDVGGYVIKYAAILLGKTARLICANLNYLDEFDVDVFGSGTMVNSSGTTVQFSFGMDNEYKCDLEIWGSNGVLCSSRVFTAPVGYNPVIKIKKESLEKEIELECDDTFYKSILRFKECMGNDIIRIEEYNNIIKQAELIRKFMDMAKR